jgi:hypothetical protein
MRVQFPVWYWGESSAPVCSSTEDFSSSVRMASPHSVAHDREICPSKCENHDSKRELSKEDPKRIHSV